MANILDDQFNAVIALFAETEEGLDGYERFVQRVSNAAFVLLWLGLFYVSYRNFVPLIPHGLYEKVNHNSLYMAAVVLLFLGSLRILLLIKRLVAPFKIVIFIGLVHTVSTVVRLVFHYQTDEYVDSLKDFLKDLF